MSCWNTKETSMIGDVAFLFPIVVLIPCVIYFSYEFNKYKRSTMISKRHPNLTLTMSIVNIIFILGGATYIFSLTHCDNHILYAHIGMSTLAASFWVALTLFELRVWLITFDNNYTLAKQNSLWRSTINSKGITFSRTKAITPITNPTNDDIPNTSKDVSTREGRSDSKTQSQTKSKSKSKSASTSKSKNGENKWNILSLSSKIESDPMWFVKNKSTLGNYNYLSRMAAVKPIIETTFGLSG